MGQSYYESCRLSPYVSDFIEWCKKQEKPENKTSFFEYWGTDDIFYTIETWNAINRHWSYDQD